MIPYLDQAPAGSGYVAVYMLEDHEIQSGSLDAAVGERWPHIRRGNAPSMGRSYLRESHP